MLLTWFSGDTGAQNLDKYDYHIQKKIRVHSSRQAGLATLQIPWTEPYLCSLCKNVSLVKAILHAGWGRNQRLKPGRPIRELSLRRDWK